MYIFFIVIYTYYISINHSKIASPSNMVMKIPCWMQPSERPAMPSRSEMRRWSFEGVIRKIQHNRRGKRFDKNSKFSWMFYFIFLWFLVFGFVCLFVCLLVWYLLGSPPLCSFLVEANLIESIYFFCVGCRSRKWTVQQPVRYGYCWKQTNVTLSIWLIEVHQDLRQQFKVQLTEQSSRLMRTAGNHCFGSYPDDARAAILRTVRTDWL